MHSSEGSPGWLDAACGASASERALTRPQHTIFPHVQPGSRVRKSQTQRMAEERRGLASAAEEDKTQYAI